MSVLDRFEKSVEGAVNGVFSKFGSKDLKPVDLSSALEREIDAEAMPVGRDRTVAPNEYRFKLSTADFDRIEQWGSEVLANELADNLTQYAKSQHYAFVGPVMVIFEEDLDLPKGSFNLSSESVQGNAVPVTTTDQAEDHPMLDINGNPYLLTESKTVIGRGSGCDIVIDDPGISRKHLEIDLNPQRRHRARSGLDQRHVRRRPSGAGRDAAGRQYHHHRPHPHPVLGFLTRAGVTPSQESTFRYDRTDICDPQVWIPDPAVGLCLACGAIAAQRHRSVQPAAVAGPTPPRQARDEIL